MTRGSHLLAWPLLALLAAACSVDRSAGNSYETENTATARSMPIDSILPLGAPIPLGNTVSTLRFDAKNFDFSNSDSAGLNLSVERHDSTPVPFQIVFWDKAASVGRIKVRIDSMLRRSHESISLRWNRPPAVRSDSQAVWAGFSDQQVLALNSALVDDFEDGLLLNKLPNRGAWFDTASASAKFANFGILDRPIGRAGKVLHFSYTADSISGQYVLIKTPIASSSRCMRSVDSIVLWARGSGKLKVALEKTFNGVSRKALSIVHVDTAWNRIAVRPSDFVVGDNKAGNVGWTAVRDSITHLTLFMEGNGELWLDDVRIHGISVDDLR